MFCFRGSDTSWSWQSRSGDGDARCDAISARAGRWAGGMAAFALAGFSLGVPTVATGRQSENMARICAGVRGGALRDLSLAPVQQSLRDDCHRSRIIDMANAAGLGVVAAVFHAGRAVGHRPDLGLQSARLERDLSKRRNCFSWPIRFVTRDWDGTPSARAIRSGDPEPCGDGAIGRSDRMADVSPHSLAANLRPNRRRLVCDLPALFWDVETLVLIVPPGGETLSLRIFNLLHYGHNSQVNALCLLLLVAGAAAAAALNAAFQSIRKLSPALPGGVGDLPACGLLCR